MQTFKPNCHEYNSKKNIFCSERFAKLAQLNIYSFEYNESVVFYNLKVRFNFFTQIQIVHIYNPRKDSQLLDKFILHIQKLHQADYVSYYSPLSISDSLPKNCKAIGFSTFKIDLNKNKDEILKKMHSKRRNMINSAFRKYINIICKKEYANQAIELINSNLKKEGQDQLNYAFVNSLLNSDLIDIWIAESNGQIQSAMIILKYQQDVLYYHGGNIPQHINGSMNLLHFYALLYYKDHGFKYYDFMGARVNPSENTKYSGLRKFKERFGGFEVKEYLFKVELNIIKCKMFSFVLFLRNFKRGFKWHGDIIDQEGDKWTQSA